MNARSWQERLDLQSWETGALLSHESYLPAPRAEVAAELPKSETRPFYQAGAREKKDGTDSTQCP